jgi:hypothetical protein
METCAPRRSLTLRKTLLVGASTIPKLIKWREAFSWRLPQASVFPESQGVLGRQILFFCRIAPAKAKYLGFLPHSKAVKALTAKRALHNPSITLHDPSIALHNPSITLHNPLIKLHDHSITLHNPSIALHNPSIILHNHSIIPHNPSIIPHDPSIALQDQFPRPAR